MRMKDLFLTVSFLSINNQSQALTINGVKIDDKIIIWDRDGTITASKTPQDKKTRIILPGVREVMRVSKFNLVVSGFKSPESESHNFDPDIVADLLVSLMRELPISAAAFSPSIGGISCYVIVKKGDQFSIIRTHEDPKYEEYIGKFKKPDVGMFKVISDIAGREFGVKMDSENTLMIGDTWHDKVAAQEFGIPFLEAKFVHSHLGNSR